ncbi:MAG: hypothetical protein AAF802_01865 [Planctomycetota bacterium]
MCKAGPRKVGNVWFPPGLVGRPEIQGIESDQESIAIVNPFDYVTALWDETQRQVGIKGFVLAGIRHTPQVSFASVDNVITFKIQVDQPDFCMACRSTIRRHYEPDFEFFD